VFTARFELSLYTNFRLILAFVGFPLSVLSHQSSSPTYCPHQKEKGAKLRNLPKNNALSEIGENWIEKYFHLAFAGLKRFLKNSSWYRVHK
jgi:hypothetical protein